MKVAIIGGVRSTEVLIKKVVDFGFECVHVWGYEPENTSDVSGWSDLKSLSHHYKLNYLSFRRLSDISNSFFNFKPDILFAVGLSQLIPEKMLGVAKIANIGFHPTALPKGRGRAPIAWIILDRVPAAATFFELGLGADDGAILAQVPFAVEEDDDAAAVETKLLNAEKAALDELLPMLKSGNLRRQEQADDDATWYGRRTPDDGLIDWTQSAEAICCHIRASAPPHPGAFTYLDDTKILILKADVVTFNVKGVIGSILFQKDDYFIVQTGFGHLRVSKWLAKGDCHPRVGRKLGYSYDIEIFELRRQIANLTATISKMNISN